MGRKIILDYGAAQQTKHELRRAQELLSSGSIAHLQYVETTLSGMTYAACPMWGRPFGCKPHTS